MKTKIYSKLLSEEYKPTWNQFVEDSKWSTILQLWEWGEVKEGEGWNAYRIGVFEDKSLILCAQILVKKASLLGNYLYIPHGPVFQKVEDLEAGIEKLNFHLISFAKSHNCFAIEIEPMLGTAVLEEGQILTTGLTHYTNTKAIDILKDVGYTNTKRNMQPKHKLFYDLELSEEELLALMKKNTRYNVRLAQKKNVEVIEYGLNEPNIIQKLRLFYDLLLKMQQRAKGYPVRPYKSFLRLLNEFKDNDHITIFEAKYDGDLITMNISQKMKSWSSSFYRGSQRIHNKVKASYLLRWESILSAKRYGSKVYDFWGFIPNDSQHKGYSDTKLSFGGTRIDMHGILAMPLDKNKYFIWNKILPLRVKLMTIIRSLKR